ncbi:MAG: 3-hydroxybutyryl-CoA dehydrogenase [Dehalococcoidia bacterium]
MDIEKVGIVGCGLMGSGYTQLCAQSGYQVTVLEVDNEVLNKGLALIHSRLPDSVNKGELSQQNKDAILARIKGTTNIQDFSDCDLVIEAATEKMEVKQKIFAELNNICRKDIVLATNTSVLSILAIAMATTRPEKVLGIHMNPLISPLAEIIRTLATSEKTLEIGKSFSKSLGKDFIIAPDSPGFIVNRLLTPFLLNAVRMLEAGIATRDDIDTGFVRGLGYPMGPLAMLDIIGLDTVLLGTTAMYEDLKDPQYAPPPLLKKMVTAGWLGCKSGKGFYEYE